MAPSQDSSSVGSRSDSGSGSGSDDQVLRAGIGSLGSLTPAGGSERFWGRRQQRGGDGSGGGDGGAASSSRPSEGEGGGTRSSALGQDRSRSGVSQVQVLDSLLQAGSGSVRPEGAPGKGGSLD